MPRLEAFLPGPAALLRAAAAVVFGATVVEAIRDEDLFWHLATGRWVLEHLAIPRVDIFAVGEPALPWVAHEAVPEALLALVQAAGGQPALVLLPALVAALVAWLSLSTATRRGVPAALAAPVVLVVLMPSHEYWVQRPHLADYLLLVFALWDLSAFAEGRRKRLWHWIPLGTLWANLHAAFILLPLVLFAHLAGAAVESLSGDAAARARLRHLGLVLPLVLLACLLTPLGATLYVHTLGYSSTSWIGLPITEWLPPDFRDPRRMAFGVVLLAGLASAALSGRVRPGELFVLCGFAIMALRWQRNVPLVLFALAPLLPGWLHAAFTRLRGARTEALEEPVREPPPKLALGLAHVAVLAALAVLLPAARWPCEGARCLEPGHFPEEAVAALAAKGDPPGRLLNHYNWGGFLIHERPGKQSYVDGRTCDIDMPRLHTYTAIHFLHAGWREAIDREAIGWVLYPTDSPLARALREEGWRVAHEDPVATVLVRPGHRP